MQPATAAARSCLIIAEKVVKHDNTCCCLQDVGEAYLNVQVCTDNWLALHAISPNHTMRVALFDWPVFLQPGLYELLSLSLLSDFDPFSPLQLLPGCQRYFELMLYDSCECELLTPRVPLGFALHALVVTRSRTGQVLVDLAEIPLYSAAQVAGQAQALLLPGSCSGLLFPPINNASNR